MRERLLNNLPFKLVAIFLAIVLWLNATGQESGFRQLVVDVPLEMRNLSSTVVANEIPETVRVRIEGGRNEVDNLDSSQLSAFVNLNRYGAGSHEISVQVTVPGGVRLVNVYPSVVTVNLTEMTSLRLPVVVDIEDGVADGYTMLASVVNPAEVEISGPMDLLEQVISARVRVTLNAATQDFNNSLPITLEGVQGDQNRLRIEPEFVRVRIPVVQEDMSQTKTVSLEAVVEGSPPEGFTVGSVTLTPTSIAISGASEILSQITSISTLPVNVNGRETGFTETVALNLPEGVQSTEGTEVTVTIEILEE